ncbi:unnamed protein product [Colias eurytheme]|nr:unnamed protein product [Colias eurytheme]
MANKCTNCGKFYSSTTDGAKCTKCSNLFHKQCNNISPKSLLNGKWVCKICKNKNQKSVENLHSQEVGSADSFEDAPEHSDNNISCLAQEIRLLRSELSSFRQEMSRISTVMAEYDKRLDSFEERLDRMECTLSESQSHTQESSDLTKTINSLKLRLNDSEQYNLLNDVEITGVPEIKGENLLHLTVTLAQKIGLPLEDRDIVNAYRAGVRKNQEEHNNDNNRIAAARPRAIVVRLARQHLRNEMLRAARVRRGADTAGLVAGEPRRFYVNEHLTRTNRWLFHLAREQQRAKHWSYVWTRGGRTYVRRDQHSKYFVISSEEDIHKIFG